MGRPAIRRHEQTKKGQEMNKKIDIDVTAYQIGPRTTRPSGRSEGVRVTDGIRRIIEDWRTKGVSPEETAQSLRIPIDEVKAIILQAHPAPAQPKRPEFLEPRYALEKPAGIGDNRRES
jgi:hypothetical protein